MDAAALDVEWPEGAKVVFRSDGTTVEATSFDQLVQMAQKAPLADRLNGELSRRTQHFQRELQQREQDIAQRELARREEQDAQRAEAQRTQRIAGFWGKVEQDITAAIPRHEYLSDQDVAEVQDRFYGGYEAHREQLVDHYSAEAARRGIPAEQALEQAERDALAWLTEENLAATMKGLNERYASRAGRRNGTATRLTPPGTPTPRRPTRTPAGTTLTSTTSCDSAPLAASFGAGHLPPAIRHPRTVLGPIRVRWMRRSPSSERRDSGADESRPNRGHPRNAIRFLCSARFLPAASALAQPRAHPRRLCPRLQRRVPAATRADTSAQPRADARRVRRLRGRRDDRRAGCTGDVQARPPAGGRCGARQQRALGAVQTARRASRSGPRCPTCRRSCGTAIR